MKPFLEAAVRNAHRAILDEKVSYVVGYFDNDEFWARGETHNLEKAQELRQSFPKHRTNLNDGLPTEYVIIKKTITHEIV